MSSIINQAMYGSSAETSLRQFDVISKLGEGSFSCVYKVQRVDDKQFYAMKKVKIGQMKEKQKENALNQVRILASITHPNVVNYREAFFDQKTQTLCIVMELADAGDVQSKVSGHIKACTHFTEAQIWQALIQLSRGLKALHQANILHRDLKCANVFCTKDGRFKLGDLNVSKVAKRGMARTQTGTPYYTSPEVWDDKAYDSKCDIWSLGCVLYEMASLTPPFKANNLRQLYAKIHKGIFSQIPSFYSQDLSSIITHCLKVNPTLRPSAHELLQSSKVIRHTPAADSMHQNNSETSKCFLLKTIMVPKNLRLLKDALPASKYEIDDSDALDKLRRVNSANNMLRKPSDILYKPIASPKVGDIRSSEDPKYAVMKRNNSMKEHKCDSLIEKPNDNSYGYDPRPSHEVKLLCKNPVVEIGVIKSSRNNSMDLMRKRDSSIDSQRRRDSAREVVPMSRDSSRQIVPNRRDSSREMPPIRRDSSREMPLIRRDSSRELAPIRRDSSREAIKPIVNEAVRPSQELKPIVSSRGKVNPDVITNRCRQIQERVKLLMENKQKQPRDAPREIRNSVKQHVSIIRAENNDKMALLQKKYAYHPQRDNSFQKNYSQLSNRSNRSIEQAGGSAVEKSGERSVERSRANSRESNRGDNSIQRKERLLRADSKKRYAYPMVAPPRRNY